MLGLRAQLARGETKIIKYKEKINVIRKHNILFGIFKSNQISYVDQDSRLKKIYTYNHN